MKTSHEPHNGLACCGWLSSLRLASAVLMLALVEMRLAHAAGTIQVEYPQYWAGEATAFVVIGVVRGPDSDAAATVDFTTVAQTATAGADYTETQGTLTLAVREKLKLITIPILNDGIREMEERFQVKLSNATGDVLGARITATVAITDNDPGVGFASNQLWVHEDQGSFELKVLRGNDQSLGTFTVEYTLIDLTAQFGVDYAPEEPGLSYEPDGTISRIGRIELAEGEMSRSIWVHVVNDHVLEPDERFQVRLSSPSAAMSVGAASTATITIVDATGMEPRRFNAIRRAEDGSIQLELAGAVSKRFEPFYSIFQVEASSDLKKWEPLPLLGHLNRLASPPKLVDGESGSKPARFYRMAATPYLTPSLPPTGPFAVGVLDRTITDGTRRNRYKISTNGTFGVTIWYPGIPVAGKSVEGSLDEGIVNHTGWYPPPPVDRAERAPQFYSWARRELPLPSGRPWPVIVYSHGGGTSRRDNQAVAENLASHGYIVAAPDHWEAITALPDGRVYQDPDLSGPFTDAALLALSLDRVRDLVVLTEELKRWNSSDPILAGGMDLARIASLGFSYGAKTAAEFCRSDKRCLATIALEFAGPPFPVLDRDGLQKPSMTLNRAGNGNTTLFAKATEHAYWLQIGNTVHTDFTAVAWFWNSDSSSAQETARTLNAHVLAFLNKHLKGQDEPLLDGPSPDFPRVSSFRKK